MSVVRAIADRVIVMGQGRIVEEGEVQRVFASPEAELTQRLIGKLASELPRAVRDGMQDDWSKGSHLVLRCSRSPESRRSFWTISARI